MLLRNGFNVGKAKESNDDNEIDKFVIWVLFVFPSVYRSLLFYLFGLKTLLFSAYLFPGLVILIFWFYGKMILW